MSNWTSFKRVATIFEGNIPDKVPKYEGSIEIKELNPLMDGQLNSASMLFFTADQVNFFHNFPSFFSLLKKLLNYPRLFYPIARYAPILISKLQRQFDYDMFSYTTGIPMVFNERIFTDFYTSENNKVIKGPDGRLVWRTSPDGAHTRHGFIKNPQEWDRYMEFKPEHKANHILVEAAVKTCKNIDIVPVFSIFGGCFFEELSSIFGFERLFNLLVRNKQFIRKAVKQLNEYSITVAKKALLKGAKYIYVTNDIGYKGRTIISPKMFRELFKPRIKKFCEVVHQYGGKVIMHSCGYIMELLSDFVEMGIDALHPIEKAAGNDIVEIKNQYKDDLVLIGNVPIPLLTHGTPKENYEYVKFLLKNVSSRGGHIISSSHSVTQWCKLKNFYAYYKAAKDFGQYPIKIS